MQYSQGQASDCRSQIMITPTCRKTLSVDEDERSKNNENHHDLVVGID